MIATQEFREDEQGYDGIVNRLRCDVVEDRPLNIVRRGDAGKLVQKEAEQIVHPRNASAFFGVQDLRSFFDSTKYVAALRKNGLLAETI